MRRLIAALSTLFLIVGVGTSALAQTGKIAGQVTDAESGEPLPGVNVVVVGEQIGATTNQNGRYNIIGVPPGTYSLRASFVGYADQVVENVEVNIDLTTTQNFQLQEETQQLQEVTVQAQERVVQPDVSANVANISSQDFENMPVVSLGELVGLQAGVEEGLNIRGSNLDEVAMIVDGQSTRQGRTGQPFQGVSYTSIQEVQVQTGGFNAEYGNVRSGLVNVVTKEGPRDRYTADVLVRYSPSQREYFGPGPKDENAFWIRPFTDPEVADVGTDDGPWSKYKRAQYPRWEGWEEIQEEWHNDNDPNNDLTIDQLKEYFWYLHRKDFTPPPEYEVDGGFGGPVPVVSDPLGDLRFYASFRNTQEPYIIPQARDSYNEKLGRLKLTSNMTSTMKLELSGMAAEQNGLLNNMHGFPGMFREEPKYPWTSGGNYMANRLASRHRTNRIWGNSRYNPSRVRRWMASGTFTHTISSNTFYKVSLQRRAADYRTWQPRTRNDSTIVKTIGDMELTEIPFGWSNPNVFSPSGVYLGGHLAKARDTSSTRAWRGQFDITSQLNEFLQVKSGADFTQSNYDMHHGLVEKFFAANPNPRYIWTRDVQQAAAYSQAKFEFQGLVANTGLRLDYIHPGGSWYNYEPFTRAFSPAVGKPNIDEALNQSDIGPKYAVSPRLGISFPVTETSKLFYNYGHFRQANDPRNLFTLRSIKTQAINQVGNPRHPMRKTVAYEVGYEHALFDQYLVRISGYYKALENQPRTVAYTSLDGQTDYSRYEPLNYEDIRGGELTVRKRGGQFVRGFANFTYMARKGGNFGFARQFENQLDQREFERNSRAHYQFKPVPQPYARASIQLLTPSGWGPEMSGLSPLGDWRAGLIAEWREGDAFTWSGGRRIQGLRNNVRWSDYYMFDLRLSKNINLGIGELMLFTDISNVFNIRHLQMGAPFVGEGGRDWQNYMKSLHLPEDIWGPRDSKPYLYVTGDDEPGDFREPGVEYQPIEVVTTVQEVQDPNTVALYYEHDNKKYMQWDGSSWQSADQDVVDRTLETKAYINMPNLRFLRFLNPRRVRFGVRIQF